ncbi:MAG: ATPase [Osedax symbiont Rs1]|nr:MAG: ATPase [Osedax symbiont Rs1]
MTATLTTTAEQEKVCLLEVQGLTHHFCKRGIVLDQLSFSIHETDKIALIGANGAGKTTLLQLLVGLIPKQSGKIIARQVIQQSESDFVLLRQQVGFVFQDPDDQLFCPSVLEDVMFGPLNQGFSLDQAQQKARQTLRQLNLLDLSERIASELSGGEKRMVTLASVLVMQPKVLLLDEPTNALDSQAKATLLALLQSLDQAMLIISHDQQFLAQLTNQTLVLKDAKLSKISGSFSSAVI